MEFILLITSWCLRTVLATKGPLAGRGNVIGLFRSPFIEMLFIATWIILLLISLYLIYASYGLFITVGAVIVYFIVAPTIFGTLYKQKQ